MDNLEAIIYCESIDKDGFHAVGVVEFATRQFQVRASALRWERARERVLEQLKKMPQPERIEL